MGKFKLPSIQDIEQEQQEEKKEKLQVGAGLFADKPVDNVMKIVYIPRNKIRKNEKNKYSIKGIASLAESIKTYGLVQPLHVAPAEDGMYTLLGGERRLTAIDLLIKDKETKDWNEDTLIFCVVKGLEDVKLDLSEENKERYAIITTNREQRKYTDADLYMEIQEWKLIIEELREKGIEYISQYDDDGNEKPIPIKGEKTRDILTQTTGISRGQINKFETVHNQGSDELKTALMDGKISVSVAEKAAKEMPPEQQKKVVAAAEKGEKLTAAHVTKLQTNGNRKTITPQQFRKDIKNITSALKQKDISLDGMEVDKYYFYIRQIEKLFGGHE